MNNLSKHEQAVDHYVKQGRTREAVDLLFKLIAKYAKEKSFVKAEALREKLFDVDSMALNEIIKSAEIIEAEKSEAVDQDHMEIWSDLYETLTTEEANTLYFALKKKTYGADEPVFKQGTKNTKLYFIDRGQLKLRYGQNGTEKLIRTLNSGSVAGEDTFFSISLCTMSLITLSSVKLNFLDQNQFIKWQKDFPVLASKIETYCSKLRKSHEILKEKGINRRAHKRIKMGGKIRFKVLHSNGKPIEKEFKGDISDISIGGLSFFIKTANRKNALMLLGRKLQVKFVIPVKNKQMEIERKGMITGVINHLFSDYSIHMKFGQLLSQVIFNEIQSEE